MGARSFCKWLAITVLGVTSAADVQAKASRLRERLHAGPGEVYLVELVSQALQLKGSADAVHDLHGAGKDMECLHSL